MYSANISDAGLPDFGPEIRILLEKSPLEPASQVWNRSSCLKNLKFMFMGLWESIGKCEKGTGAIRLFQNN